MIRSGRKPGCRYRDRPGIAHKAAGSVAFHIARSRRLQAAAHAVHGRADFGDIGACLRDARIAIGWSVVRMAKESGVSSHCIYLYEKGADPRRQKGVRGTGAPNVRTVEEVSSSLNVSVALKRGRWSWEIE